MIEHTWWQWWCLGAGAGYFIGMRFAVWLAHHGQMKGTRPDASYDPDKKEKEDA